MENSELVMFNKDEVYELLSEFEIKTKKEKGKVYVVDKAGEPLLCDVCERKIEVKKIGSIAQGSRKIFCDNPLCLSSWVAKNKL